MKAICAAEPSLRYCDVGSQHHLRVQGTLPRNPSRWGIVGPRGERLEAAEWSRVVSYGSEDAMDRLHEHRYIFG